MRHYTPNLQANRVPQGRDTVRGEGRRVPAAVGGEGQRLRGVPAPRTIEPRRKRIEYGVEHHDGYFYILTNEDAVNFKLVRTPVTQPGRKSWSEVVPHDELIKLDAIEVFAEHLVLAERRDGR